MKIKPNLKQNDTFLVTKSYMDISIINIGLLIHYVFSDPLSHSKFEVRNKIWSLIKVGTLKILGCQFRRTNSLRGFATNLV